MKKWLLISSILLVVFFLIPQEKEVRIRIISNSNSEADLSYKAEVVDFFKEEIVPNISLTKEYLENNVSAIESRMQNQFPDVKLSFVQHTFTNKAYNGNAIKNGKYDTLVIRIGDALGDNWWASVYGEIIQKESDEVIEYRWWIKELVGVGE